MNLKFDWLTLEIEWANIKVRTYNWLKEVLEGSTLFLFHIFILINYK